MSTEDGTPNASRANNPLGWVKLFSQQEGYLTLVILLCKQVSQSFFAPFCVEYSGLCECVNMSPQIHKQPG